MTLKLSRTAVVRPNAEAMVDRHFARLIAEELGPLAPLYALKRQQAQVGSGALLDDDREAILARAKEQDERVAALDRERREIKARIRAAKTTDEIKAIVAPYERAMPGDLAV